MYDRKMDYLGAIAPPIYTVMWTKKNRVEKLTVTFESFKTINMEPTLIMDFMQISNVHGWKIGIYVPLEKLGPNFPSKNVGIWNNPH